VVGAWALAAVAVARRVRVDWVRNSRRDLDMLQIVMADWGKVVWGW
jgi:hypothetical protein